MPSWRVARSLDTLLAQINAAAPKRSKVSDGSIGDAAHASRASDHNPWITLGGMGIVTARDYTHDPAGGLNCNALAASLVASRDKRIKYVIWNRRILSGAAGPNPWTWRPYTGANPHDKHLHLSVETAAALFDGVTPWAVQLTIPTVAAGTAAPTPTPEDNVMNAAQEAKIDRLLAISGRLLEQFMGGDLVAGKPGDVANEGRGHELWDGTGRRMTLLNILREAEREGRQLLPARAGTDAPKPDTVLGHAATGAGEARAARQALAALAEQMRALAGKIDGLAQDVAELHANG